MPQCRPALGGPAALLLRDPLGERREGGVLAGERGRLGQELLDGRRLGAGLRLLLLLAAPSCFRVLGSAFMASLGGVLHDPRRGQQRERVLGPAAVRGQHLGQGEVPHALASLRGLRRLGVLVRATRVLAGGDERPEDEPAPSTTATTAIHVNLRIRSYLLVESGLSGRGREALRPPLDRPLVGCLPNPDGPALRRFGAVRLDRPEARILPFYDTGGSASAPPRTGATDPHRRHKGPRSPTGSLRGPPARDPGGEPPGPGRARSALGEGDRELEVLGAAPHGDPPTVSPGACRFRPRCRRAGRPATRRRGPGGGRRPEARLRGGAPSVTEATFTPGPGWSKAGTVPRSTLRPAPGAGRGAGRGVPSASVAVRGVGARARGRRPPRAANTATFASPAASTFSTSSVGRW